jgi:catechol 2,3-dioxygenase-like lactoylglutathione lyase family enzyme
MTQPPITAVIETALHVEDVRKSMDFYDPLFRFPKMVFDDRLCAYDVAGRSVFLLFKKGGTLQPAEVPGATGVIPPHDGSGHMHMAFAIPADSVDAWADRLSATGVAIESRVKWVSGGTSLYFRDPDGHLIELATPGLWPNY